MGRCTSACSASLSKNVSKRPVRCDLAVVDGWRQGGLLAVFSDLGLDNDGVLRRTRLWLAVEGSLSGAGAGPVAGVPAAAETLRGLVILEFTGLTDVFDPRRLPSGR